MNTETTKNETPALMSDAEIFKTTADCIAAWNTLDVEKTLATYSDDVVYQDPGTHRRIHGKEALRKYLTKFFQVWDMVFRVTEDRRIAGANAQVCVWEVDIKRHGTAGPTVTCPGMDIIHVRGGQLTRDEAFMDRLPMQILLDKV